MLDCHFIRAERGDSRRLMVVLHGLGDSMAGYMMLPGMLNLPGMNYLLVNAPDAYFTGFSWYDFAGDPKPGVARSRKLLFNVLDQQREKGFPTEQTVLFGFSQGCLMVVDVGFRYPRVFAALVGVSGYVLEPERLIEELSPVALQQRLLFTHGTRDPLIPFAAVREQVNLLKAAGLHVDWHEFAKEHTIAGEAEMSLIRDFICARFPSD